MAFVTRHDSTNGPLKQLFGFQRIHLNPGQSRDVYFSGPTSIFASFDKHGNKWLLPGSFQVCTELSIFCFMFVRISR